MMRIAWAHNFSLVSAEFLAVNILCPNLDKWIAARFSSEGSNPESKME
jgi:hypothetical protein